MARFHVNPTTGGVGRCAAALGKCPYGGEDGFANHYNKKADAMARAEEMLAEEYGTVAFSGMSKAEQTAHKTNMKRAKRHVKAWTKNELRKSVSKVLNETQSLTPAQISIVNTEKRTQQAKIKKAKESASTRILATREKARQEEREQAIEENKVQRKMRAEKKAFEEANPELVELRNISAHNARVRILQNEEKAYKANQAQQARAAEIQKTTAIGMRKRLHRNVLDSLTDEEKALPEKDRATLIMNRTLEFEEEIAIRQRQSYSRNAKLAS